MCKVLEVFIQQLPISLPKGLQNTFHISRPLDDHLDYQTRLHVIKFGSERWVH